MTLILSPQVESRLVQGARLNGLSPEAYAEMLLLRGLPESPLEKTEPTEEETEENSGGSAYDLFKDLLGGYHGKGGNYSENFREIIEEGMAEKERQGHL